MELTKAYCDMDNRIAALVPDHIELKRQQTLAKGDEWCDFLYYRK
nr:L-2-amino-thiazoline-4-carboxylic acid hydrolase [Bacteroidota bacterium]